MGMSPRLLRPRATGGFSPKNISGLQLWLDAADSSTVTLNGSTVSEWRDKSGNGIAITQATASRQPTYESAYVNGRNALRFDGNDWLYQSSLTLDTSLHTIFCVLREDGDVFVSGAFVFGPLSGEDYLSGGAVFAEYGSSDELLRYNNNAGLLESGSGLMPLSVCVLRQSSFSSVCRRNGSQKGSASGSRAGSSESFVIGTRIISGAPYAGLESKQTFCEMIRYSSSLSDSAVSAVEKYLAHKWGVSLA